MDQFGSLLLKIECAASRYFRHNRHVGGGLVGKEASLTCPSTHQDFWDTSEAMVVSPEATAYRLPRQDAPNLRAQAEN